MTRERDPLGWAATQNNLGVMLATLGERESGTARLEEAKPSSSSSAFWSCILNSAYDDSALNVWPEMIVLFADPV